MATVAFFTEGRYNGVVPLNNNMTTILAWQYHLQSEHFPLHNFSEWDLTKKFDIGIIVPPKSAIGRSKAHELLSYIKQMCVKVAVMQEGPARLWTDFPLEEQIQYLDILNNADFILCHNESDRKYFSGILDKNVYVMEPVLVHEAIPKESVNKIDSPIIGGNMCGWYNGMSSFIIALKYLKYKNIDSPVYAPSMGRKADNEHELNGLIHLPYMHWSDWMAELNKFKIGIHMMPTVAAGTFSLNCAYWGIPCIGNKKLDAQYHCFPLELSVDIDDMESAIAAAQKLATDDEFYKHCADYSINAYNKYFHPDVFKTNMNLVFEKELKIN